MKANVDHINSGLLELYVMGITTDEENNLVEQLSLKDDAIQREIDLITNALVKYVKAGNMKPSSSVKKNLMQQLHRKHTGE